MLNAAERTTFLVSVLLNYEQVYFTLDGQEGLLHEVIVESGGDLELPFSVRVDEPGWHDLIVLGFADPYNNSTDVQYRMSGSSAQLVGRRLFLNVEGADIVHNSLSTPLSGTPIPENVSLGFRANFATMPSDHQSHPSELERQLYVDSGQAGTNYSYQLWLANMDTVNEANYALVLFHNFQQSLVGADKAVAVHLSPGEEAILDIITRLDGQPGVNQIQAVFIYDPYKSVLHQDVWLPFVYSTIRMAVVGE